MEVEEEEPEISEEDKEELDIGTETKSKNPERKEFVKQ